MKDVISTLWFTMFFETKFPSLFLGLSSWRSIWRFDFLIIPFPWPKALNGAGVFIYIYPYPKLPSFLVGK